MCCWMNNICCSLANSDYIGVLQLKIQKNKLPLKKFFFFIGIFQKKFCLNFYIVRAILETKIHFHNDIGKSKFGFLFAVWCFTITISCNFANVNCINEKNLLFQDAVSFFYLGKYVHFLGFLNFCFELHTSFLIYEFWFHVWWVVVGYFIVCNSSSLFSVFSPSIGIFFEHFFSSIVHKLWKIYALHETYRQICLNVFFLQYSAEQPDFRNNFIFCSDYFVKFKTS